jgi:hypothetical protein
MGLHDKLFGNPTHASSSTLDRTTTSNNTFEPSCTTNFIPDPDSTRIRFSVVAS